MNSGFGLPCKELAAQPISLCFNASCFFSAGRSYEFQARLEFQASYEFQARLVCAKVTIIFMILKTLPVYLVSSIEPGELEISHLSIQNNLFWVSK